MSIIGPSWPSCFKIDVSEGSAFFCSDAKTHFYLRHVKKDIMLYLEKEVNQLLMKDILSIFRRLIREDNKENLQKGNRIATVREKSGYGGVPTKRIYIGLFPRRIS